MEQLEAAQEAQVYLVPEYSLPPDYSEKIVLPIELFLCLLNKDKIK